MSPWDRKTDLKCPECGAVLTFKLVKGERDTFDIVFSCESNEDDVFAFEIATGLSDEDVCKLKKGEVIKKEMAVKVVHRLSRASSDFKREESFKQ